MRQQQPPHAAALRDDQLNPPDVKFKAGASLEGTIGIGDTATAFKGIVLRVDEGKRIACKILVEPLMPP